MTIKLTVIENIKGATMTVRVEGGPNHNKVKGFAKAREAVEFINQQVELAAVSLPYGLFVWLGLSGEMVLPQRTKIIVSREFN